MFLKSFVVFAVAAFAQSAQAQTEPTTITGVINNMTLPSELLVINPKYPWHKNAAITQYAPTGTILPSWWTGTRPLWCYTVLSWFTAYEGTGNAATNTRVQVRDLRMYLLSNRTRAWTRIDLAPAPYTELWKYPFDFAGTFKMAGVRTEPYGGYSFKPAYPTFHHGYGSTYKIADPADIRAVYVAMDFRLVVDDKSKPDDREKARYVVNAGADYYPGNGVGWGVGYAPGVGGGRYLKAQTWWRTATMLVPNTRMGATFAEMRNNQPPLLPPSS